jgi:hypothetical protein
LLARRGAGFTEFELEFYDGDCGTLHDIECFIVLSHDDPSINSSYTGISTVAARVMGLILQMVPGKANTYKRIGMFEHALGGDCSDEERATYPESTDFDVENSAREVFTII